MRHIMSGYGKYNAENTCIQKHKRFIILDIYLRRIPPPPPQKSIFYKKEKMFVW